VSQFSPPTKIDQPIFSITEQATYSNTKPIPVEEKLPEGLIFKVQIGAFRNPIPQDLYKGFAPISGIKANNGLTRYYAGYFNEFTDADFAKERVRERGYKDAFVVAFFNGERIPIFQAINILASQGGRIPESLAEQVGVAGTAAANTAQTLIPQPGAANFQLLPNQNQLYYTVQVGAFSQQVSPSKLFNLQPLYVATANNGMLRYHVGIFDNVRTASAEKNKIVQIGITDAFVTAYLNGQRVTIEQASQEQQKGTPLIKLPEINQPIRQEQTTTQNNITNMQSNSNSQTNALPPAPGETEFSVQIGAYNFEVPNDIAAIYLSLSDKQVSFFKDENNLTIYRAGRFKNYKDAENLKNEIAKIDLLKGAFVIAVNKNKKINLEDAINAAENP
jgi:cell division septation protein DedD